MKGEFDFKRVRSSAFFGVLMSAVIILVAFFPLLSGGTSGALIFLLCMIPVGAVPAVVSFIPYFRAKRASFEADDEKIVYCGREYPLSEAEGVFTTVSRYGQDLVVTFADESKKPLTVSCLANADDLCAFISVRIPASEQLRDTSAMQKKLKIFETAMVSYFIVLVVSMIFVIVFIFRGDRPFPDGRTIGFGACALISAVVLFFTAKITLGLSNRLGGAKFANRRHRALELPTDGRVVRIYSDSGYFSRFLMYDAGDSFFCVVQLVSDDGAFSELHRSSPEKTLRRLEKAVGTDELILIYNSFAGEDGTE